MKFGLTSEQFALIKKMIVDPLVAQGARVYCYGSRARGDYKPFSDLDLMVESSSTQNLNLPLLSENIQNSNFPFKVDLVHFRDFAEAYKHGYEKNKIPFE